MTSIINFSDNVDANTIYCFPYAGGSTSIYYPWSQLLSQTLNVCGVQFPGKGGALFEPPIRSMEGLIKNAYKALNSDNAFDGDYYLFGHSLGAKVVIMLTIEIARRKKRLPNKIFLSGSSSPEEKVRRTISKDMNDDEFVSLLREMKGTPEEVLNNKELLSLCLPAIRADFEISESFTSPAPETKIPVEAVVLYSDSDVHVLSEHVFKWQNFVEPKINFIKIDGDHFFVDNNRDMVINAIKDNL